MKTTILAAALALAGGAQAAQATVFDVLIDFMGGQLGPQTLDISLDFDPSASFGDRTTGLTVNPGTSFSVAGGLVYSYYEPAGYLYVGGSAADSDSIDVNADDVLFIIGQLDSTPQVFAAADSDGSMAGGSSLYVSSTSISVGDVTGVPLPAGLPLVAAGLAGLGLVARRKRRG